MRFFSLERNLGKELGITFNNEEISDENDRLRLLGNNYAINKQGGMIDDLKQKGFETADILREANREQRGQRDQLVNIANTNNRIALEIQTADAHTKSIMFAQYKQKIMMAGLIVLLFIAAVLILLIKIFR